MQKIAEQTIKEVKQFNDIVGFIQQYLPLKRRGRNYIGLCPFHGEKTPSFTVSPDKKIFHCFGCHASGDIISFAQDIDNLTFYEAIEVIAGFANINVIKEEKSGYSKYQNINKEQALSNLSKAVDLFKSELKQSKIASEYVKKRDLSDDSITSFELGFLKDTKTLMEYFKQQNINEQALIDAHLLSKNEKGVYCRFQHRLIFPIKDFQNRCIGFGSRLIDANQQGAKYVNSDESALFNKRKILYGMNVAKKAIKEQQYCILVEGYMDVITCHQFGFTHAVGCMGTALTYEQVALIKRLTQNVILMLDQDEAGLTATEKSYEQLKKYDMNVKIVSLNQKDPADFLNEAGKEALNEAIANAEPAIAFMFERLKQQHKPQSIEETATLVNAIIPYLKLEKDELIQEHYAKEFAANLGIQSKVILAKLNNLSYNATVSLNLKQVKKDKIEKVEESIIYILASNVESRSQCSEDLISSFVDSPRKQLLQTISTSDAIDADLLNLFDKEQQVQLSQLLLDYSNQIRPHSFSSVLSELIGSIKQDKEKNRIQDIKKQIKELEEKGDEAGVSTLLNELLELKKERP